MNWFKQTVNPDTKEDIQESLKLESAVKQLKAELATALKTLEDIEKRTYNSDFVIDWSVMRAFSFERSTHGDRPISIIGYFLYSLTTNENGESFETETVKEWTLHCSDEQHEKLAKDFRTYLKASK